MIKSLKIKSILALFCLLFVLSPGTCGAQETYQLTESQLMEWKSSLNQLKANNQQLQILLTESKLDSEIVKQQLEKALANSQKLELQIQESLKDTEQAKKLSIQTQEQLKTLNYSFKKLSQAEKDKIRKVTLERDGLILYLIYDKFIKK